MYLSNICYLNGHIVTYYVWFVNNTLLCVFSNHSRVCILITDVCRGGNVTPPHQWFLFLQIYLLNFICFNEHIVTYFIWFVILRLLCIFCKYSRVCILTTDFFRGGNVNPPSDFFSFIWFTKVFVKYFLFYLTLSHILDMIYYPQDLLHLLNALPRLYLTDPLIAYSAHVG